MRPQRVSLVTRHAPFFYRKKKKKNLCKYLRLQIYLSPMLGVEKTMGKMREKLKDQEKGETSETGKEAKPRDRALGPL